MINNIETKYGVGPLLYTPALNEKLSNAVIEERLGINYSLAICLEDTIAEADLNRAQNQLVKTLQTIGIAYEEKSFFLPKLFIRVRNPQQIMGIYEAIRDYQKLLSGFVLPKYTVHNAREYNREIQKVNERSETNINMMPTLEGGDILELGSRTAALEELKERMDEMGELVLNVRVGGNDFSNAFSIRRQVDETIYDNLPIAHLLSDIITMFSREYVVSGPVWEYFSGDAEWKNGLMREMKRDLLNGFIGKTVIHPNQIPVVNEMMKPTQKDYEDAKAVLCWEETGLQVGKSEFGERMNEVRTHTNWARKIMVLSKLYGVKDESLFSTG